MVFIERSYHLSERIRAELVRKISDTMIAFDFNDDERRVFIALAIAFEVLQCPFCLFCKCGVIPFEFGNGIDAMVGLSFQPTSGKTN